MHDTGRLAEHVECRGGVAYAVDLLQGPGLHGSWLGCWRCWQRVVGCTCMSCPLTRQTTTAVGLLLGAATVQDASRLSLRHSSSWAVGGEGGVAHGAPA